jgi:probable RNA-binding protein EIF1AD
LYPSKKGEEQMKAGRKNLRRACDEGAAVTLAEGESIMQVLTLRGSNVIEVRRLFMLPRALGFSRAPSSLVS